MNCLPNAGGLYDQDWEVIKKFSIITTALEKKREFDEEQEERKRRLKRLAEGGE